MEKVEDKIKRYQKQAEELKCIRKEIERQYKEFKHFMKPQKDCLDEKKKELNKYLNDEQKSLVRIDYQALKKINCKLIKDDILVINNGLIRHDSIKLANIIFNFLLR